MALLGGLGLFTAFDVRRIEQAHPPAGRFVEVSGGRIHLVELGPANAVPVVLLHGASGNLEDMRLALGDKLAERHRVILVDRPGHGWSSRLGGSADASPARQAALIHDALQRIGIRRAVIVGHSWSGALATAYALAYPDAVSGLLLLAPVTHPWKGGVGWYNPILTTPIVGPLFARTMALPIGKLMIRARGDERFCSARAAAKLCRTDGGRARAAARGIDRQRGGPHSAQALCQRAGPELWRHRSAGYDHRRRPGLRGFAANSRRGDRSGAAARQADRAARRRPYGSPRGADAVAEAIAELVKESAGR